MRSLSEKLKKLSVEAETVWGLDYNVFANIIEQKHLKVGVEIGVAFGGHSEAILTNSTIDKLYGIDPYCHRSDYEDPMNFPQDEFDILHQLTVKRLSPFAQRYQHIRHPSKEAVNVINGEVDFVYIDADHSYEGVWEDLCVWFSKVRVGGIIGGHDFNQPGFPGVEQAVKEFFRRFEWNINEEGNHVWWVEKQKLNVSFIMPAYNCENTVSESVESIMEGNFEDGDELVIVNDCSSDTTENVVIKLKDKYSGIKIVTHARNKGGGYARNTAIESCQHPIIFCLDSDNVLVPGSIGILKTFFINTGADVASFQELHYFKSDDKEEVTHKWSLKSGRFVLEDAFSNLFSPGASGNYMFTQESWRSSGGYPDASMMDAWGFGFRQLITGAKVFVMPDSFYYHRYGHNSYWIRNAKNGQPSLIALQVILPYIDRFNEKDVDYMMSRKGRYVWFENIDKRPISLKPRLSASEQATDTNKLAPLAQINSNNRRNLLSAIKTFFARGM